MHPAKAIMIPPTVQPAASRADCNQAFASNAQQIAAHPRRIGFTAIPPVAVRQARSEAIGEEPIVDLPLSRILREPVTLLRAHCVVDDSPHNAARSFEFRGRPRESRVTFRAAGALRR